MSSRSQSGPHSQLQLHAVVEMALVKAFISPRRQARWLSLLGSVKGRRKLLDSLNHCCDLDPRYTMPLPSTVDLVAILRERGAPETCCVLSDVAALDGRELPLAEAITGAELAGFGTLISCIPGRLGCYIDEAGTRRRLLLVHTCTEHT